MKPVFTDQYTPEQAHAAARTGARWMAKECPNWLDEIDLSKLNLADPMMCVLGQTAKCITGRRTGGSFFSAMSHLRDRRGQANHYGVDWEEKHGFVAPRPLYSSYPGGFVVDKEQTARYEMLTIAWRELIVARKLARKKITA